MDESAPKSRVLVVDDDVSPRESLRALLSVEWDIVCAASVDEAVSRFRETNPDLVIMDIRMPGKSGIDGLREIRQLDASVSVIMLTGFGTLETAQDALRLGANDYIRKPYKPDALYTAVRANVRRTLVERRRSAAESELKERRRLLALQMARMDDAAKLGQKSLEMAHDISTPLTIILNYVSMLEGKLKGARDGMGDQYEESIKYLKVIDTSAVRCHELLDSWRAYKTGAPRASRPVSLAAIIADIANAAKPMTDAVGAAIKVQVSPDDPWVMADGIQIFRSIQNHVTNAIHAVAGAGGRINISCRSDGAYAEVRVEDNGCGISHENLDKLFQPYFTTNDANHGSGLGMFISRNVIEDHGGTINVESELNKGTRVIIRLPLCAGTYQEPTGPATTAS